MWKIFVSIIILAGLVYTAQADAAVFSNNLVRNGDFTTGITSWGGNITSANVDDQYALDGAFLTMGQYNATTRAEQIVSTADETGRLTVRLYYRFFTTDDSKADYFSIKFINVKTGATLAERTMYASHGQDAIWKKLELEATKVDDADVKLVFSVTNDNIANSLTFVDIDQVKLTADSFAELKGTVLDSDAQAVRNANVVVKNAKGAKVWEGNTNSKGIFLATHLKPRSKPYAVTVTKGDVTSTSSFSVKWAKQTKLSITL